MIAFRLELRRSRGLLIWLCITLLAYGGLMGLMYPFMVENDALIRQYLDAFPKGMWAAFGMSGGTLSDPGVFFNTYISSWLWPIMAVAVALVTGTRTAAADLDRGFIDLPLATPVSRVRYLAASIWAQVAVIGLLALAAVGGLWAAGRLVGAEFDLPRFLVAGVLCFAFGTAIAGVATLVSVITLSRGTTSAIVAGLVIAMYALFVVTGIADDWAWLAPLSAWGHFGTTAIIDYGAFPIGDLALFAAIAVAGWAAALWAFRRRDLAA